ncbi:vacuolar fusion protein MON1 [Hyaloraphidium curvatum]|nr:vacuolar fusion protein MON1 [Hyaloraphidium curvatum]
MRRSREKGKGKPPEPEDEAAEPAILADRTPHALVFHSRKLSSGSLMRQATGELPTEGGRRGPGKSDEQVSSPEWSAREKHVFVLSAAGKPVYTRYGDEAALAPFAAVVHTIIAFFAEEGDSIRCLNAGDHKFVFLLRWPLYLLCVSRTGESEHQLRDQLRTLHSQIVSLLTATQLQRIFEQRLNYDLRNLLGGAERQLTHLPDMMSSDLGHLMSSIQSLRLKPQLRQKIGNALSAPARPKSLVFAVLIAKGKLVTLLRPRKHSMNPSDLLLILNLLGASPSARNPSAGEAWSPVCLPRFNPRGFLHAYLAPLAEDLTLVALGTEKEGFFEVREWREAVEAALEQGGLPEKLREAMDADPYSLASTGVPHLRHFVYKSRALVQFTEPGLEPPHARDREALVRAYAAAVRLTRPAAHAAPGAGMPPATAVHLLGDVAVAAAATTTHEMYGVLSPLCSRAQALEAMEALRRWGRKAEEECFVLGAPTF